MASARNLVLVLSCWVANALGTTAFGGLMLNEILVDTIQNDGSGGEWVELYASTNVNLNGYTLTDGDWTVSFQDFDMSAGQVLLVGFGSKIDAMATPGIDLEVPGPYALTGASTMSLTNSGEYVLLSDGNGLAVDGLQWGPSGTASNRNAVAASFHSFSGSIPAAQSLARQLDGLGVWEAMVNPSPGIRNVPVPEPSAMLLISFPLASFWGWKHLKNRLLKKVSD